MLIKEVNHIFKAKCSKSFFIYIGYDSCWTFANGSLNPDLFFPDIVHLLEKGNLKLAESIFSSIENYNNGVTCNKHKQFLVFDFPPLFFSTASKLASSIPSSLSFVTACSSSSDISALSHKPLSEPVSPVNVCLQNPLALLLFSSIVTVNIFVNLILLKVIFLTNFTSLRKRLILFISLHSSYLRSMLDTVIIFQSFRTILKISASDVSFFTRLLCISAIFNIIVLNFAKKTSFSNICRNVLILRQNLKILLQKQWFASCLFLAIRVQYYWFCH